MSEKLIIKNFGPIKSVELELGRFNVLIGEQATGKTMVAKLLAMCRYFSYITNIYRDSNRKEDFSDALREWGLDESIRHDSEIIYDCLNYSVEFRNNIKISIGNNEKPTVTFFSRELHPKTNEFEALIKELSFFEASSKSLLYSRVPPVSFFQNSVSRIMDNPFFIPTERGLQSIFSLGKSSIQNINDALFNQFARIDQILRHFSNETEIEPLGIIYQNINGKGFYRIKGEEQWYSMANAPSGFQTSVPVVLLLKYYSEVKKKNKTFIIEEPELNLFPTVQQKLVQYLAGNNTNYGNSILINTHSPYVLSSINNMLYAHKVGQTNEYAVNEIIPKEYWLDPSEFSAYRLLSDGTAKNIVDAELEEIMVEELDGAGKEINAVYDKILDIKFRSNEKSKRLSQLH